MLGRWQCYWTLLRIEEMYRFPKRDILESIIGNKLIMVSCNVNQIYLHFDSNISISIESTNFQVKSEKELIEIGVPIDNLAVFKLIEQKVIDISLNEEKTILEIIFNQNQRIILTDDEHYETHVITIGKKKIIV
jgi:hypothetical protein